jgi:hypothetical protein
MTISPSESHRICGFAHNSDKIKVGIEKYPSPQKEMRMKNYFNNSGRGDVLDSGASHPKPSLTVDVEKYQAYLDGSDMTEAQKEEFLQALWSIIVSFVELGFGVHPLQEVCGKTPEIEGHGAKAAFDGVSSEQPENNENTNDFSP